MGEVAFSNSFLLGLFADFYEEVARIKLAIYDGRLPVYLAEGDQPVKAGGAELAAMVSKRLYNRLQLQARSVRANSTDAEIKAYSMAQFVMAALADELFILSVDWPGRGAWMDCTLERALFRTSSAGKRFFDYAAQVLQTKARTPLHGDLAAVFLIALQLGFKGQYRGRHKEPILVAYRRKLLRFVDARPCNADQPVFFQAYRYVVAEAQGQRLAPLSRWYRAAGFGAGVYLVVSSLVWVASLRPFVRAFGGG